MTRLTFVLLAFGGLILIVAMGWWWITYGEVIRYGYLSMRQAGTCLVGNSDLCSLAKALCSGAHPRIFVAYWTGIFWVGVSILFASLVTLDRVRVLR